LATCLSYDPTPRTNFEEREHCTDALGSFVVKGNNEKEILSNIDNIVDWFLSSIVWANEGK
jgi:hypothetical protein